MNPDDQRFRIAAARRMLARDGCESLVAGHVSERAHGEDAFWISPFEYFDETLPERVVKVGFDLSLRAGVWEPSPAVQFHASIYLSRPDVNGIVHTHSQHLSTAVTRAEPVERYATVGDLFAGAQACYVEDGTTPPVAGPLVAEALGDKQLVLLNHHGVVLVGSSLEAATAYAVLLEQAARFQVAAETAGASRLGPSAPNRRDFYSDTVVHRMWRSGLRRLQRSDPDLFSDIA